MLIQLSPPLTSQNHSSLLSLVLSFTKCHILGFIQYVDFPNWLLLHSNEHYSFLHVFSWLDSSFLFNSVLPNCTSLFLYSPTKGRLGRFKDLAIRNKTAISIHMQFFCGLLWVNKK